MKLMADNSTKMKGLEAIARVKSGQQPNGKTHRGFFMGPSAR